MEYFIEHVKQFNRRWKDLPRRGLIVAGAFVAAWIAALLLPFFAPFLVAALAAWLLLKPTKAVEALAARGKLPRKIADALVVALFYGALVTLMMLLGVRLADEIPGLIAVLPEKIREISALSEEWAERGRHLLGEEMVESATKYIATLYDRIAAWAATKAGSLAAWTWDTARSVPRGVLFVVLMMMGTFYFLAEREKLSAFLHRWMPDVVKEKAMEMRRTVFKAALGQIRAAVIMAMITSVELMIGFSIMRVQYGLALGFIIGVVDVLPILGAGLFLIPMALYGIATGEFAFGLGTAALYGIVVVLRQIVEPRVVSGQLGLHPLETMVAMYAGLRAIGVAGMLLGPVMLLFLRALLATSEPKPLPEKRNFSKRRHASKRDGTKERS